MNQDPSHQTVVLVHGLWYGPWSMKPLARRLRRSGFTVREFAYRSTSAGVQQHARALAEWSAALTTPTVHWLGHSLGGLVIVRALREYNMLLPGRAVLLGSPLQGSAVARRALKLPGHRWLFGAVADDLCRGCGALPPDRDIGLIAGSRAIGLGRLLGSSSTSGDGTVALSEADAPGLADRTVLPLTHTSMLFSDQACVAAIRFFRSGRFAAPEPPGPGG